MLLGTIYKCSDHRCMAGHTFEMQSGTLKLISAKIDRYVSNVWNFVLGLEKYVCLSEVSAVLITNN